MKTRLSFVEDYRDQTTGDATWSVLVEGQDGLFAKIEKSTVCCGDGYSADAYSVIVYLGDGEKRSKSFKVGNIYGNGMPARNALRTCKQFVLNALIGKEV